MWEERRGSGGPAKEKYAKTQEHEMIQQDGEWHKPSGKAEALRTEGTCTWRLARWARPHQEGLKSHANPTGLQLAGKEPYLWTPYAP